jgi:hypothetical protein
MTDKILSDARSLLAAMKSLDTIMKTSLQTMETASIKPPGGTTSTTGSRRGGHKTADGGTVKPEVIRRNSKVGKRPQTMRLNTK